MLVQWLGTDCYAFHRAHILLPAIITYPALISKYQLSTAFCKKMAVARIFVKLGICDS